MRPSASGVRYLISAAAARGARGVVTGASVLSPQVSMTALVARHFGLPSRIVLGATNLSSALRHPNVAIAALAGAEFHFAPVAYNPALQRSVAELGAELGDWYRLPYAITTPEGAPAEEVEAFHAISAAQVANLPPEVESITMTAGSCNSCVSVLYGVARYRPESLRRVTLLGVGPTRLAWIENRLTALESVSGLSIRSQFRRRYHHGPAPESSPSAPWELEHFDLHSTRFAAYQDRMPFALDGIDFHPTYEGKALSYMDRRRSRFPGWWAGSGADLFWIVGSAPSPAAIERFL